MIKIRFKINEIRKLRGMTQQDLSDKTGVPQSSVSRACMDYPDSTMNLSTLVRYAEALNVDVKDLFEHETE